MATRATLRTRARIRADQTDSTFPTDTEYNYLLDEAAKEAWYDLISAGWPINFSAVSLTATGTNPIAIGASGTVAFIRGVYRVDGSAFIPLRRINEGRRGYMTSALSGPASDYDVLIDPTLGPVVELFPRPSAGTYRVEYIAEHPGFAADGTAWYGPARSDELIVLRAAAKGMRKEGNDQDAMQLDREYSMLLDKVQQMASWFDMRNPQTIRDVGDPLLPVRDPFDYDVMMK